MPSLWPLYLPDKTSLKLSLNSRANLNLSAVRYKQTGGLFTSEAGSVHCNSKLNYCVRLGSLFIQDGSTWQCDLFFILSLALFSEPWSFCKMRNQCHGLVHRELASYKRDGLPAPSREYIMFCCRMPSLWPMYHSDKLSLNAVNSILNSRANLSADKYEQEASSHQKPGQFTVVPIWSIAPGSLFIRKAAPPYGVTSSSS